jgi:predicted phosphate transport protein (TIGR00153 family)
MGLKEFFFPKERNFSKLLLDQADKSLDGIIALEEFITKPGPEAGDKVKRMEQDADDLRHILITELNKSFITPFDREDIFALSRTVDDVVDYAKSTVGEMALFKVDPNPALLKMVNILRRQAEEISRAIFHLQSKPSLALEHAQKAKKLENEMERTYQEALVELFKEKDTIYILKVREIYRHLSNAADRADEAGDIIGDIVVKLT